MTFNYVFFATSIMTVLSCLLIQACGEKAGVEGRQTYNKKTDPTTKPVNEEEPPLKDLTCEQKWEELVALWPKDLETSHQKSQIMTIKNENTVLAQSIVEKSIIGNNGAQLEWREETKLLAPEEGTSSSTQSIKKETYLNLCNKKIKLSYTDRPTGKTPKEKRSVIIKIGENEYEAESEIYDFSKDKEPINKDTLTLVIGSKDPYKGILFKSTRVYFQLAAGQLATMTLTKELLNLKPVEK